MITLNPTLVTWVTLSASGAIFNVLLFTWAIRSTRDVAAVTVNGKERRMKRQARSYLIRTSLIGLCHLLFLETGIVGTLTPPTSARPTWQSAAVVVSLFLVNISLVAYAVIDYLTRRMNLRELSGQDA